MKRLSISIQKANLKTQSGEYKKRESHLLTSGDEKHRRHNFNLRKIYVTEVWRMPSLGEYVLLACLVGMERLLP